MAKHRVLIELFNETAAKGVLGSRSLDSLAEYADLDLIHSESIPGVDGRLDRVYSWPRDARRDRAWLALYQLHLLPFTRQHYPERLDAVDLWLGFRRRGRRAVQLFDHGPGRALAVPLLRRYLSATNPLPRLLDRDYDAVLSITGFKEPLYEDLVRFARARGTPVLAVTQNWDNINYKPIVERPDMLGVWGMQGYYVARLVHAFSHRDLVPVGCARMEVYFDDLPDQTDARERLDLPPDVPILLFAGAGPQFEETSLVEQLNQAVEQGKLPRGLLLLYKPHPRRMARPCERPLDWNRLSHVRLVPPTGLGSVAADQMPVLLRAVDGLISPYSTLLLEGALCGRPCLAIAYDDPAHPAIRWETVRGYIHLSPLAFSRWSLCCSDKRTIISGTRSLLDRIRDPDVARQARLDVQHVVYHDGRDFGARVADALDVLIKRKPAA